MNQPSLAPYENPDGHEAVSTIIRRHSSNKQDVRLAALRGIDLGRVREVLDLGCGFGFMSEEIARRIAPGGRIVGVDACGDNAASFETRVRRTGHDARFVRARLEYRLPFGDARFDLVVCSYSLYFFPQVIPDLARVLKPDGILLALTHSDVSFKGLLRAIEIDESESELHAMIDQFSAENGRERLTPHFAEISQVRYGNLLHFYREDGADLQSYIRFKMPLICSGGGREPDRVTDLLQKARSALRRLGWVKIEKDDAAFICRRPR